MENLTYLVTELALSELLEVFAHLCSEFVHVGRGRREHVLARAERLANGLD